MEAYQPAWDINHFPFDVEDPDGTGKAPTAEFDFEEDTNSKLTLSKNTN